MTDLITKKDYIKNIRKKYPSLKVTTIEQKYVLYMDYVIQQKLINICWRDAYNDNENPNQLNKTVIDNQLKTFRVNNKSYKWIKLFEEFCPLYKTVSLGDGLKQKISNVEFTMEDISEYLDYTVIHRTFKEQFDLAKTTPGIWNHVDMESLDGYIQRQKTYKQTAYKEHHIAALDKSIVQATCLLEIAKEHGGQIPQYAEQADSGRLYYKGFNLQIIKSEVREAAFGDGYSFDIKASAFALMIEMTIAMGLLTRKQAETDYKILICYIKHRNEDRKLICSDLYGNCKKENIKKVKQALTSIGFGAKKSVFYKNAIPSIFKDTIITNQFNNHYLVKDIVSQFKKLQDLVWDSFKDDDVIEFVPDFPYKELRRTKSKVLAHLYQSFEAFIMLQVLPGLMVAPNEIKNVLYVHDAIYTTDCNAMKAMKNISYELQKTYPLIQFDSDKLNKWAKKIDITQEEIVHKRFIEKQERIAENYVPNNILKFKP